MNIKPLYTLSKQFVDTYEHEQRHEAQARKLSPEKQRAYNALRSAVLGDFNRETIQTAAKKFVDICDGEEREQRHELPKRDWSSEKQRAYGKLLDCAIGRMSPETICNAAIELARACKPEREKPQNGEVYRDIFGNTYIIIGAYDEEPIKKSFVTLIYFNAKGKLSSSEVFTVPLEDFMNPTFKKV